MKKPLLFFILVTLLFSFKGFTQVNFDSLNRVVDTTTSVRDKIDRFYNGTSERRLSKSEIVKFKDRILEIAGKSNDKKDLAYGNFRTAWLYYYQFNYNEALVYYFKMLKIAEELKDSTLLVIAHSDIADTYIRLQNRPYALKHIHYGMPLVDQRVKIQLHSLNDMYNNLNSIYLNEEKYDSAMKYCELRVKLNEKRGMKSLVGRSLTALGIVYLRLRKDKEAIAIFEQALEILKQTGDKKGESRALSEMGQILMTNKQYDKAIVPLQRAIELSYYTRFSSKYYTASLFSLADCYYRMGDFRRASDQFMKYKTTSDSLTTEEIKQQIAELSAKYETDKKDAEIGLQEQQIKTSKAENSKQRVMIIASGIALTLAFIAIFFIYRSFQLNKRNAKVLAEKNRLIEEKQKEIIDSIKYAKRIQIAHLPTEKMVESVLKRINKN